MGSPAAGAQMRLDAPSGEAVFGRPKWRGAPPRWTAAPARITGEARAARAADNAGLAHPAKKAPNALRRFPLDYFRALPTSTNSLLMPAPSTCKAPMIKTAINEAISAHSIAVAPDFSLRNFLNEAIMITHWAVRFVPYDLGRRIVSFGFYRSVNQHHIQG